MTRKFMTLKEYAKLHKIGICSIAYRVRSGQVPMKYLRFKKSKYFNGLVQNVREDYKLQHGRAKSNYNCKDVMHTVYLPGGIPKVLQPNEYKKWRKNVVQ